MGEQIQGAIKRVRGYWFVDGFTEMAAGALFIIVGGLLLLSRPASPAAFSTWFMTAAGQVSIVKLGGILAGVLVLWWLKDHFTYPRTGFVRGKPVSVSQVFLVIRSILLFVLLPILGLLAALLLLTSSNNLLAAMPVWFPVGLGILWAALLAVSGEWMGLRRFRILAALTLVAGIAIGIWQSGSRLPNAPAELQAGLSEPFLLASFNRTLASLSVLVLICGVIVVFSGLITFLRYRKENPLPYAEDE